MEVFRTFLQYLILFKICLLKIVYMSTRKSSILCWQHIISPCRDLFLSLLNSKSPHVTSRGPHINHILCNLCNFLSYIVEPILSYPIYINKLLINLPSLTETCVTILVASIYGDQHDN